VASVWFPFLFGVMYGDIGHGSILFLFGICLCTFNEKISQNKSFEVFSKLRYAILLMGFFATYMGLIYNDFMSIPLSLFGPSCYIQANEGTLEVREKHCVYPFGIDPAWMNS